MMHAQRALLLALVAFAQPTLIDVQAQVASAPRVAVAPELPRSARARDGMVVTGSAFATDAAARVLAAGGNAVDAAVTAGFVLGVVEPSMSGIGGRTQILLRTKDGRYEGLDGATQVPRAYPGGRGSRGEETYGYESVGVPGTVAALTEAQSRYGSWPLSRVLEPAINLAEHGFRLPAAEAARIASVAAQLREFEGTRHYFLRPDGSPLQANDLFRQPDLARTLRGIAQGGAAAFYGGDIARQMETDALARGGFLRVSDLAAYRAQPALIVRGEYRGHQLVGTYLPASGATTIEILQILEHLDLPAFAGTGRWAAVLTQAMRLGFADRNAQMEPATRKAAWLTSRELAAERARQVRDPATSSQAPDLAPAAADAEPEHTTHLSVADRDGMLVALTQSVGPSMGSRVAAPGLGFIYAATMGYLGTTRPGDRPFSSQSPMFVLRDQQPLLVLGGAGARRIISAVVEVVSRVVDQRLSLDSAMALPRFHAAEETVEMEVRPATAWQAADLDVLRAFGLAVRTRGDAPYFARINGIAFDRATREWLGVADSRWEGAASGPRSP